MSDPLRAVDSNYIEQLLKDRERPHFVLWVPDYLVVKGTVKEENLQLEEHWQLRR